MQDAWEISRYREEAEESLCTLTGEEKKSILKPVTKSLWTRESKDVREYLYILVALIRLDGTGNVIIGQNGILSMTLKS